MSGQTGGYTEEEEMPRRKKVKICHVKDMWYLFVPKFVERLLRERGIGVGDAAIWELESATDGEVVARVVFRK
ncbi:MAG: hypothetical protein QXU69_09160 [Thermofilaceae archaeon]